MGPIEDLAFDPVHCRLASVGGGHPQVWSMNEDCECWVSVRSLFRIVSTRNLGRLAPVIKHPNVKPLIAKNVVFCDDGMSLLVFYLESHEVWVISKFDAQIRCLQLLSFGTVIIIISIHGL